jgi:hypothetical protein
LDISLPGGFGSAGTSAHVPEWDIAGDSMWVLLVFWKTSKRPTTEWRVREAIVRGVACRAYRFLLSSLQAPIAIISATCKLPDANNVTNQADIIISKKSILTPLPYVIVKEDKGILRTKN